MYTIEIQNLDETIAALNLVDKKMAKRLKRRIVEITKPTLSKGAFANSLSLRQRQNGVVFISSDPGGGVIEFANPGAIILTGKRAGRRAGVPHTGDTPRALLKAILEDEENIIEQVNDEVAQVADLVGAE